MAVSLQVLVPSQLVVVVEMEEILLMFRQRVRLLHSALLKNIKMLPQLLLVLILAELEVVAVMAVMSMFLLPETL